MQVKPVSIQKTCRFFPSVGLLALIAAGTTNAAPLAHRYSLNGDGTDSVAGANGTLNNPGGTATFSPTALTTTNANATDFLSLPSTVGTGINGDFTIEDWLTQNGAEQAFTSIFSLSASTNNFILLNPNRNGGGTTGDFKQPGITGGGSGSENNITTSQTNFMPFGTERQIVVTYVSSTGVASIYNNGTLIGSGNIGPGFSFQSATDQAVPPATGPQPVNGTFDAIGGGDAFADLDFNGATDDFRIYSSALTQSQISALTTAGPNATNAQINGLVPEPASLTVVLGIGTLLRSRQLRRRDV